MPYSSTAIQIPAKKKTLPLSYVDK